MHKLIITAAVVLAACSSNDYDDIGDMRPAPAADVATTPSTRVDWVSDITPIGNSGIRGQARARTVGNVTRIMINIEGAPPNTQHPWRVHKGACGDNGAMVGNPNEYPALTSDASGRATGRAQIAVPLKELESYYVNILNSPTDPNTIVACGRLAR